MPTQTVNAIAVDPATPQTVYLAGPDGLFRSTDGGLTWEAIKSQLNSAPLALTLDPRNPAMLFTLLADGALLRSDDSGITWKDIGVSR